MPTQLLPIGPPTLLVQNQIYALPAVEVTLFTDATTPTIQTSNTSAFTANVVVTLTGGAAVVGGGFIRATTAGATITLKRD
jgi:hypothetical protein